MENTYYFTFGSDHLDGHGLHKYVEIKGAVDLTSSRDIMFALFGPRWAFQYTEGEFNNLRYQYERHMLVTVQEDWPGDIRELMEEA